MKINQAVILAGGIGSRTKTRVYDNNTPKVMFRINNKPILQNILEIIHDKLKISSIIVVISKGDNQIRNYFGNGKHFGVTIDYVESDSNLGIADALYLVKKKIHGTFLVMLGDEFYINSNHSTIINKKYNSAEAVITFTNTDNPQDIANNYSIKVNSAMRVKSLIEKPKTFENNMLGLGTFIFKDSIFDYIQKTQKSIRTKRKELIDVISILSKEKIVYAHKLNSSYVNINTIDDWKHAKFLSNKTYFNSYRKSLVIPSYNEVESLPFVINDFKDMVDEIIVADGGSTDGTIEKILNFEHDINLKIIRGKFVGYGDALRNGIEKATGNNIVKEVVDFYSNPKNRYAEPIQIGYLETIRIEPFGDIIAKFDTGNSAIAPTMHADEISVKNKTVTIRKLGSEKQDTLTLIQAIKKISQKNKFPIN